MMQHVCLTSFNEQPWFVCRCSRKKISHFLTREREKEQMVFVMIDLGWFLIFMFDLRWFLIVMIDFWLDDFFGLFAKLLFGMIFNLFFVWFYNRTLIVQSLHHWTHRTMGCIKSSFIKLVLIKNDNTYFYKKNENTYI